MNKIQKNVAELRDKLQKEEKKNTDEEKGLLSQKNDKKKRLESLLGERDFSMKIKRKELYKLKQDATNKDEKIEQLRVEAREIRMKKEIWFAEDVEWERKAKILQLETEEQIEAVRFVVGVWKVRNIMKKNKKKRKKKRRKKRR